MKRGVSILLSVLLLLTCVYTGSPEAQAAIKVDDPRTIAIVFDNSNSMYKEERVEWCRATYAMEVFASMLNQNDTLLIYPMHAIQIGETGKEVYTMEKPLRLTGPGQSETIRKIVTKEPGETPIESIDCAIQGLKTEPGNKKYLIVLTDGGKFNVGNSSKEVPGGTRAALDKRFQEHAGKNMTIMYLGIGMEACEPATKNSDYFMKKMARNSQTVLSSLTDMCNLIFGRDTLPPSHKPNGGKTLNLDVSISKLIVFAQGKDISNLTLTNKATNQQLKASSTKPTKYSEKGNIRKYEGDKDYPEYGNTPDTSLQGLLATFTNVPRGEYTVSYSGGDSNDSIEVYYEPDVDMVFEFTDENGNQVNLNELYEGKYTVKYGIWDNGAAEGEDGWVTSGLLGNPEFKITYYRNGEPSTPETTKGLTGQKEITLRVGETFKADMTVTYLSGYTIQKKSKDFGWPDAGVQIVPKPAGNLRVEVSGGNKDGIYPLQSLESGAEYVVKIYHEGQQLTGAEFQKVEMTWNEDTSNAKITVVKENDCYKLKLSYKDPAAPQNTVCGECRVALTATYQAEASDLSKNSGYIVYTITEDSSALGMELIVPEDYIVISDLPDSKEITVALTINGQPLTAEQFQNTIVKVDCSGIQYTLTPCPEESAYKIKLLETDGIEEDDYAIKVSAEYTDQVGRVYKTGSEEEITLSTMPLWLKWAIFLLILLILIIIILIVMHIKVLPKYSDNKRKGGKMFCEGEEQTAETTFDAKIQKGQLSVRTRISGAQFGVAMDVKPGKKSYLRLPNKQRYVEVNPASVRRIGNATIEEIRVGRVKYVLNTENNKLECATKNIKMIELKHAMPIKYSGTFIRNGSKESFEVTKTLNFEKKK